MVITELLLLFILVVCHELVKQNQEVNFAVIYLLGCSLVIIAYYHCIKSGYKFESTRWKFPRLRDVNIYHYYG